jgi:hypothetical protein
MNLVIKWHLAFIDNFCSPPTLSHYSAQRFRNVIIKSSLNFNNSPKIITKKSSLWILKCDAINKFINSFWKFFIIFKMETGAPGVLFLHAQQLVIMELKSGFYFINYILQWTLKVTLYFSTYHFAIKNSTTLSNYVKNSKFISGLEFATILPLCTMDNHVLVPPMKHNLARALLLVQLVVSTFN